MDEYPRRRDARHARDTNWIEFAVYCAAFAVAALLGAFIVSVFHKPPSPEHIEYGDDDLK